MIQPSIKSRILEYLMEGNTLTHGEVDRLFNTVAGQQRLNELRREGEPIDAEWKVLPSGKRVLEYYWRVPFAF